MTDSEEMCMEAGEVTWNAIATQEDGKEENGPVSSSSAREGYLADPPSFLSCCKASAPW